MTETIFIGANNGGLEIYKGAGNLIAGNIQTAKTFKYVMDTHGIDIDNDTSCRSCPESHAEPPAGHTVPPPTHSRPPPRPGWTLPT